MTIAELYDVQLQLVYLVNELLQMWLAGTFAFIVAFHAGRGSLDRRVFVVGSVIYIGATALLILRFVDTGAAIGQVIEKVESIGGDPLQPAGFGLVYFLGNVSLMLFGTAGAVWFAYRAYKREGT